MATHEFAAGAATIILPLAGGAAAVGAAVAFFLWRRGLLGILGFALFTGVALVGGSLLALVAPSFTSGPKATTLAPHPSPSVLAQRADALLARAIAPNSPLACIDAVAGDQVEAACEAVLFGRPETIAAAVSYVMAKIALLAQGPGDGRADDLVLLRENLAADRYGIVAHVLAATAGCSPERCNAFALVKDPTRIKAHLRDGTFDQLVAKHAADWPPPGERSPTAADASDKAGNSAGASPSHKPVSSRYDFPSAASIPPVSIMVPEASRGAAGDGTPATSPKPVPERRPATVRPPAPAAPTSPPPASPLPSASTGAPRDE